LAEPVTEIPIADDAGIPTQSAASADDLLASGDAPSFERLYQQHVDGVYRYVASRVATREDAEDVTSDAFRRAWGSLSNYRRTGTFKAWLFGVVRRALADYYRERRPTVELDPEMSATLADEEPGPEERALATERRQIGRRLLAALTPEQQEVLLLRFLAELSYAEIAQVLGKREDAIKKIAYRALARRNQRNDQS
jgi:RNA polymerase sigma-70 factor (ECF subfamily)